MAAANEQTPAVLGNGKGSKNTNRAGLQSHYKPYRLNIHFLIGGKVVCAGDYRLSTDTRFIELPLPITRLLVSS